MKCSEPFNGRAGDGSQLDGPHRGSEALDLDPLDLDPADLDRQ